MENLTVLLLEELPVTWKWRRRGEISVNVVVEGEMSRRRMKIEEGWKRFLLCKRYDIMWKKLWRLLSRINCCNVM
jgi:hypothetical protein